MGGEAPSYAWPPPPALAWFGKAPFLPMQLGVFRGDVALWQSPGRGAPVWHVGCPCVVFIASKISHHVSSPRV